jgi:hypothetical protein
MLCELSNVLQLLFGHPLAKAFPCHRLLGEHVTPHVVEPTLERLAVDISAATNLALRCAFVHPWQRTTNAFCHPPELLLNEGITEGVVLQDKSFRAKTHDAADAATAATSAAAASAPSTVAASTFAATELAACETFELT